MDKQKTKTPGKKNQELDSPSSRARHGLAKTRLREKTNTKTSST
jgi:hypothetical protein